MEVNGDVNENYVITSPIKKRKIKATNKQLHLRYEAFYHSLIQFVAKLAKKGR